MTPRTLIESIAGPVGRIECAIDAPEGPVRGVAVVCHPHPQFGGTMDNKVVQTLARAFVQLGWRSVRFNFRGIGGSTGTWDEGRGEVDDALAVLSTFRALAAEAASRLPQGDKPERLVLVGPSTQKQQVPAVPPDTVVIHGETDDIVPLAATFDWARPQSIPVIVFPGVGHFFHGQLGLLKTMVVRQLQVSR